MLASGLCTLAVAIIATGLTYKEKLDSVDRLQARIEALEKVSSTSGKFGTPGERGPQGQQGSPGSRGEQGPPGPKGEPGVQPAQITDLERRLTAQEGRLAALEKRASLQPSSPTTTGSLSPAPPLPSPGNGFRTNTSGCLFIDPDAFSGSTSISTDLIICTADGQTAAIVTRISDDKVYFRAGRNEFSCPLNSGCFAPWNSRVTLSISKISLNGSALQAQLDFKKNRP